MKKRLLNLLIVTFLLSSCSKEVDILIPNNIPGENFTGTWYGSANSGTMKLKNLKFLDDSESNNYKVTGLVTLVFLNNSPITTGEFNPADNNLKIKASSSGNTFTIIGTYSPKDEKFKGTWFSSSNSGNWSASKDE